MKKSTGTESQPKPKIEFNLEASQLRLACPLCRHDRGAVFDLFNTNLNYLPHEPVRLFVCMNCRQETVIEVTRFGQIIQRESYWPQTYIPLIDFTKATGNI